MKRKPSWIAPILKAMAKDMGLEAGMDLYALQSQWQTIVGPSLAPHTYPQAIQHKVLNLQVDSAPWMHELAFLKADILQKVNQALGKTAIQSIRLKMAPVVPLSTLPQTPLRPSANKKALSQEDKDLIRSQLDSVSDDALKLVIRKAMAHHLREEKRA